uniref:Uncharacterized protein n=1 Tax=Macrostomum lignano TaxID=282301 RepID=A0A1I8FE04_9PLAT
MPKEVSKQKPFNQMLRVWRYSVQRGRIFVFSSDRNPFSDYSRAGSDDDLANAFNPTRTGGEIGRLPTRSVLCERSPWPSRSVVVATNSPVSMGPASAATDSVMERRTVPSEVVDRFFECNSGGTHFSDQLVSRCATTRSDCSTGLGRPTASSAPCKANEFNGERTRKCIPNEQR